MRCSCGAPSPHYQPGLHIRQTALNPHDDRGQHWQYLGSALSRCGPRRRLPGHWQPASPPSRCRRELPVYGRLPRLGWQHDRPLAFPGVNPHLRPGMGPRPLRATCQGAKLAAAGVSHGGQGPHWQGPRPPSPWCSPPVQLRQCRKRGASGLQDPAGSDTEGPGTGTQEPPGRR
jgi:hypothetical protein